MAVISDTWKKVDIFNVKWIEEEWLLIQESEKLWWEMSLEESYRLNMEKIKNLKL